jgi:hypothetical protein
MSDFDSGLNKLSHLVTREPNCGADANQERRRIQGLLYSWWKERRVVMLDKIQREYWGPNMGEERRPDWLVMFCEIGEDIDLLGCVDA